MKITLFYSKNNFEAISNEYQDVSFHFLNTVELSYVHAIIIRSQTNVSQE